MFLALKPTHATVKAYYDTIHDVQLHFDHEGAVRGAFQTLLAKCGQRTDPKLTLIAEYPYKRGRGPQLRIDGALVDLYKLPHGYWEAKDERDDLLKEVERKLDKGYPSDNTIFQAPERAILYQRGTRILDENITRPEALVSVVNQFFEYKMPHIEEWERAVNEFSDRVPELSQQVESLIREERGKNPSFRNAFDDFYTLTRQAINPNLSEDAVERMLVQHLLTERIFRRIFRNDEFRTRNVVAIEIEKVITELTKRSLNRDEFLKRLEPFYHAIERNAENATDYTAKQDFLNTVYMRFFQGYSPKEADTHGIVYTPQPIVNFMVRSVEEILQKEFGRSLSDKGVHILDPFVGTGNFITRIMQEIKTTDLPYKYENELHCNEVMLLPYYIASMNIEHAYFERVGEYQIFPGICLVDTFELAESKQVSMFTEKNTARVERQKQQEIFVVIGNPPYNANQVNENDNNKNRSYPVVDGRVLGTYAKESGATLKNKYRDPYIRAIRWASDRIGKTGLVVLVTNNSFVDDNMFDGIRACLEKDFDSIYIFDLGGNTKKNPRLSGTVHNVFGIPNGVSINVLIRNGANQSPRIRYARINEFARKEEKYAFLDQHPSIISVQWKTIEPDDSHSWLIEGEKAEFGKFIALATKEAKKEHRDGSEVAFTSYCLGVSTNRDEYVYNFDQKVLSEATRKLCDSYNYEVLRFGQEKPKDTDGFVDYSKIKWSYFLKKHLEEGLTAKFEEGRIRRAYYRPFTQRFLYADKLLVDKLALQPYYFPNTASEFENRTIYASDKGLRSPFSSLMLSGIGDLHLCATTDGFQCFPFYTYAEDGTHRRENITDWALEQFRAHYHDPSIAKWDIFHYIYAVLHHPEYRERYAANLRRELPRIPFIDAPSAPEGGSQNTPNAGLKPGSSTETHSKGSVVNAGSSVEERPFQGRVKERKKETNSTLPKAVAGERSSQATGATTNAEVFRAFVKAGQRLAEIHVHYEQQPEYKLAHVEKKGEKLDYRVEKMKLSKDKTTLIYNKFLTLSGIPKETYEYRLGNRSALEWIIDQYQVSTDKRSGITNDPNREDDREYILRLIGQVITVSLETAKIVASLPELKISEISTT